MTVSPFAPASARVACFSVRAAADPGSMPRVLHVFAKENLVPTRWTSACDDDGLVIDIQMAGLTEDRADYFARVIGRMPMVTSVLTRAHSDQIGSFRDPEPPHG